jgi:hypothetical protein
VARRISECANYKATSLVSLRDPDEDAA